MKLYFIVLLYLSHFIRIIGFYFEILVLQLATKPGYQTQGLSKQRRQSDGVWIKTRNAACLCCGAASKLSGKLQC